MHATGKMLGKNCLKTIRDTFSSQYVVCIEEKGGRTRFFGGGNIQQKGKVKTFGYAGRPPSSLSWWDNLISSSLTISIFFQSKRFAASKVKDQKEVTNLNLLHNLLK